MRTPLILTDIWSVIYQNTGGGLGSDVGAANPQLTSPFSGLGSGSGLVEVQKYSETYMVY